MDGCYFTYFIGTDSGSEDSVEVLIMLGRKLGTVDSILKRFTLHTESHRVMA